MRFKDAYEKWLEELQYKSFDDDYEELAAEVESNLDYEKYDEFTKEN